MANSCDLWIHNGKILVLQKITSSNDEKRYLIHMSYELVLSTSMYIYISVSVPLENIIFIFIGWIHRNEIARSIYVLLLLASFQHSYNYITIPTSSAENPLFPTSLSAIDRKVLFNLSQSDGYKKIPHCYFNLDFCDCQWIEYIWCHLHMAFSELYFGIIFFLFIVIYSFCQLIISLCK